MLHEYAIEPAALTNFKDCKYILEKMGVYRGRYIADFPNNWYNAVRRACSDDPECLDITRKRIIEFLRKFGKCVLCKYRFYDEDEPWLENSERAHLEEPFHAILAKDNPRNNPAVVKVDDIEDDHTLIAVPREVSIPKATASLLQVSKPFLELSSEVVFVDGSFNPDQERYKSTTRAFLTAIKESVNVIRRLEYHTKGDKTDDGTSFEEFERSCQKSFQGYIPRSQSLKIYRWSQRTGGRRFHARYLLTNIGGLRFEYGMDEAYDIKHGRTGQETDVTILDNDLYIKLWERFKNPSNDFEKSDESFVEIT